MMKTKIKTIVVNVELNSGYYQSQIDSFQEQLENAINKYTVLDYRVETNRYKDEISFVAIIFYEEDS